MNSESQILRATLSLHPPRKWLVALFIMLLLFTVIIFSLVPSRLTSGSLLAPETVQSAHAATGRCALGHEERVPEGHSVTENGTDLNNQAIDLMTLAAM